MDQCNQRLIFSQKTEIEVIKGRSIYIEGNSKVGVIEFTKIFDGNYGASDFIAICRKFEAIFIKNMKKLSMSDKNMARRFILFVYIFFLIYFRLMKFIIIRLIYFVFLKNLSMSFLN